MIVPVLTRFAFGAMLLVTLAGCGQQSAAPKATMPALTAEDIALNNRGVALMGSFDYPGARQVFRQAVDRKPHWHEVKINLAIATLNRQREGDEALALQLASEVLEQDPGHVRGHYVSGLLRLYQGDVQAAAAHFAVVAEADPNDAYAAYYRGQALESSAPAEALALYLRAIELDPYLRSAYYRAALAQRGLGNRVAADEFLQDYQRLADNPRARLAEFKYTRMGERGNAWTVNLPVSEPLPARPAGPLYADAQVLAELGDDWTLTSVLASDLTTADLEGDGIPDWFVTVDASKGPAAFLWRGWEDELKPATSSPLLGIRGLRAAAWGDIDNDGRVDVFLCRASQSRLYLRQVDGGWLNVTDMSGIRADGCRSVGMLDADHDGDLDILVAGNDGAELFSNDRDGGFRRLGGQNGLEFAKRPARQVLATDLDNDRDADLIVIGRETPNSVFRNDRLWRYERSDGPQGFATTALLAAVTADVDADGQVELYAASAAGQLLRWSRGADGSWRSQALLQFVTGERAPLLAAYELDGDGRIDLLLRDEEAVRGIAIGPDGAHELFRMAGRFGPVHAMLDTPATGPSLIALEMTAGGAQLKRWPHTGNGGRFAAFRLSGKEDKAESMRSNRDGIGARLALRSGSLWTSTETFDNHSGSGQSLQPVFLGLGSAEQADYLALTWSDGVFQTELAMKSATLHSISETQRQLSSCPVVFAWNGETYQFVSDVLGVGGLGFLVEPGVYATPRPWEKFLLPAGLPVARDGHWQIKITEPMEEIAYLDHAQLQVYDLPPGWQLALDERMQTGAPAVTGEPLFYRRSLLPARASDGAGNDLLAVLAAADAQAADPGRLDPRFIGRTLASHQVTLEFDQPLDALPGRPVLLAEGWVEYPYSQTVFAAWQAEAGYAAPTLEARVAGRWQTVHQHFGYPAGMPRQMALPLDALPPGADALRLTSNLQLYWDALRVIYAEVPPDHAQRLLSVTSATVEQIGFPLRSNGPQYRPGYDFDRRTPFWDTRYLEGEYTALGEATALVGQRDAAFAIIGPGEALALQFDAPPPVAGLQRFVVLSVAGYAKDMDMFTRDGGRVAPLPGAPTPEAQELHRRFNTRHQSGS